MKDFKKGSYFIKTAPYLLLKNCFYLLINTSADFIFLPSLSSK
jgi:hypothetical protein